MTHVHTTSRRGMLAVLAAAPVMAAAPLAAQLPDLWQQRKAAFIAARNAEDLYDRAIAIPSWRKADRDGTHGDAAITAESDRLCDIRSDAEEALIRTPAPDLGAVIWKIEHARERWAKLEDWPDRWWDSVMADLRRLSGGLH